MSTATISAEINAVDVPLFKALLERFKAKKVVIKEEKDDTKMTKEEFFAKIDRARNSTERKRINIEEFKAKYL